MDYTKAAVDRVKACIEIAGAHYGRVFPVIETKFDIKGSVGGMYCFRKDKEWFRLNRVLLEANYAEYESQTIPHEVAHYVTRTIWGRRAKAHGAEWKSVMRDAFGLKPDRCHSMDTSIASNLPYIYKCACREFSISTRKHNQYSNGRWATCKLCKARLVFDRFEKVDTPEQLIPNLFVSAVGGTLTKTHIDRVIATVAANKVKNLIGDGALKDCPGVHQLGRLLRVSPYSVAFHHSATSLPAGLTHAIVFDGGVGDRQRRIAKSLEANGVKVRMLQEAPPRPAG